MSDHPSQILYGELKRQKLAEDGHYHVTKEDVSWLGGVAGEIQGDDSWDDVFIAVDERQRVISHLTHIKELVEKGYPLKTRQTDVQLFEAIGQKMLADAPDPHKKMTWQYQAAEQLLGLAHKVPPLS